MGQPVIASSRILRAFGSFPLTILLVVAFALQALWVAVSARFDIYDEPYHLAAIKAFSTRWTPFFHQTTGDGPLGDIERYGSYLYPYLLSFPYRAAEALGFGEGVTIVMLRMFSVLAVSGALVYTWRLFRELAAGPVTANVALAVVSLLPLTVFLAGTLNYDNLLALLSAAFLYYGLKLYKADHFDVGLWLKVLLVGGFAAVTKFTFLPLAPVVVVASLIRQVPMLRGGLRSSARDFFIDRGRGVVAARMLLTLGAILASALVIERYGLNLLQFGTPVPSCLRVHGAELCSMNAPLARNSAMDLAFKDVVPSLSGAVAYVTHQWLPLMMQYLTLIGVVGPDGALRKSLGPHIFGAILAVSVALVLGLAATLRRMVRGARMLLAAGGLYTFILFAQNYLDYTKLGEPAGVQGRYVLVVLPIFVGVACIAVARLISRCRAWARPVAAVGAAVMLAIVLSQGGGVTTYLWAGDRGWWRTDSGVRFAIAQKASHLAHLIVIPDRFISDPRL